MDIADDTRFDFIIVGSGFGGSVSALRLVEKGYSVLLLEKGRRFSEQDFPKTNWDLPRWLWMPRLGFHGLFQMSFLRHLTVFSGVGVGGGSLVYGNTLPVPKASFFQSGSWAGVADWETELAPHYLTAKRMLGATQNPRITRGDEVLRTIAKEMGREDKFELTDVGVYFGHPGQQATDPYFGGNGPPRTGCIYCGGCMTGCRHGAKNTLDKNYLYLAEQRGLTILAQTEATAVRAGIRVGATNGFRIEAETWGSQGKIARRFTADQVVLAGGVLGTVDLLLKMKEESDGLPRLSDRVGEQIRTNSESLIGVTSQDPSADFSDGIAITSILHTDDHSHVEPVRYARGSGFFRLLTLPHTEGERVATRLFRSAAWFARNPVKFTRVVTVSDWARYTQILLYMRSLEGTLTFVRGRDLLSGFSKGLVSKLSEGTEAPKAFIPEATEIAKRFAEKVNGTAVSLATEVLMGTPSTAHILGGANIGSSITEGVIDGNHQVYGYPGLYVIDGAAVSANPGVNPSLTITAMAERAMARIVAKH